MKKILSSPNTLIFIAVLAAVFFGLFSVLFVSLFGEKLSLIVAVPAVMIVGLLFIFDRHLLFMLILVSRSALDPLLDKHNIGGVGVGGVLNALVILIALIALCQKDFKLRSLVIKTWLPFLSILFIAVSYAPDPVHAVKTFLSLVSNAAMFTIAIYLVNTKADYGRWMRVILLSSVIPVFYGFYDYSTGGVVYADAGKRVASTFSHPNILAFYLMLMITLSFYFIKSKILQVSPVLRRTLPFYIIIMMVLLLFTKTRSAWIACFAFFALYGLFYERKFLVLVIVTPFLALLIPDMQDRILDLTKGNEVVTWGTLNSYAWRQYIWRSGLEWMETSRYFLGYGVEAFMHYSVDFFPLAGNSEVGAHNVYVQLFFDTGILGLLSFVWLYTNVTYNLSKYYKQNKLMIFCAIMLIGQYMLIAYSDNMLSYLAFNWYFWFLLGACYAISYHDSKRLQDDIALVTP